VPLIDGGPVIADATMAFMFRAPQVNFYVQDIEASVGFYRDLLGFTETFRTPPQGTPVHVELRLDGFTLGLATIESLRDVHGVTVAAGPPRAEVVVWADDVDAAFASLRAKSVTVLSPPHDFLASLRATWIADPEGNPVQIVMRRASAPSVP
jgi:lactoylglutathione lyase